MDKTEYIFHIHRPDKPVLCVALPISPAPTFDSILEGISKEDEEESDMATVTITGTQFGTRTSVSKSNWHVFWKNFFLQEIATTGRAQLWLTRAHPAKRQKVQKGPVGSTVFFVESPSKPAECTVWRIAAFTLSPASNNPVTSSKQKTAIQSFLSQLTALKISAPQGFVSLDDLRSLCTESKFYPICCTLRPSWTERVSEIRTSKRSPSAETMFGFEWADHLHGVRFSQASLPELNIRCASDQKGAPGFNGELKSVGDTLWSQAVTYSAIDMLWSFFSDQGSLGAGQYLRRFYPLPPFGYSLIGMGNMGFFLLVQMIGPLFVSPYTEPFLLGSDEHAEIVKELPHFESKACVDLSDVSSSIWETWIRGFGIQPEGSCLPSGAACVCWTASPVIIEGKRLFFKVISWDAYNPDVFLRFTKLYTAYQTICDLFEDRPNSLLPARLLFGCCEVAVEMPFVDGCTTPSESQLQENDEILSSLASAIFWLAMHDIAYTDVRPQNVLIRGTSHAKLSGQPILVDYDDCLVVKGLRQIIWSEGLAGWQKALSSAMEQHGFGHFPNFLMEPMYAQLVHHLQNLITEFQKAPTISVHETTDSADLLHEIRISGLPPGIKNEGVVVEFEGGDCLIVTVKTDKKTLFSQKFALKSAARPDDVMATFSEGTLTVQVSKPPAMTKCQISIRF